MSASTLRLNSLKPTAFATDISTLPGTIVEVIGYLLDTVPDINDELTNDPPVYPNASMPPKLSPERIASGDDIVPLLFCTAKAGVVIVAAEVALTNPSTLM
jgi:hypothetical protein